MAVSGKQVTIMLMLFVAFVGTTNAASYTVGDSTGWAIPSSSSFYTNWAAKQTFQVGDTLVFNFQSGSHTVAEVTKAAYDACTTSNPISAVKATAPASYTLSTGTHYYLCTVSGHCLAGQKLSVTVTGPSTTAPTPSPTKTTTPAPTPSPTKANAPTPSTTTSPPTPAAPTPSGGATGVPPTASPGPSGGATGVPPTATSTPTPPADSFATSTSVGLFSFMSLSVLAFLF